MKILIISPYYAPYSEVGAVRMISLTDYLSKQGYDVTVYCLSEEELLKESYGKMSTPIPEGVKVIRFKSMQKKIPLIEDYLRGKAFARQVFKDINFSQYDIVLCSCGPYYTLECLPQVKKKTDILFIIDFRDLGAINYRPSLRREERKSSGLKNWIKANVAGRLEIAREKKAIQYTDLAIAVSDIDREKLQAAYEAPASKFCVITNGYDEEKLRDLPEAESNSSITAAVFGKFMYYSQPRAVAILKAIQKLRIDGFDIQLLHIGQQYPWIEESITNERIDSDCYRGLGLMDYRDGMAIISKADFFVVEDTSPDDVGTKIYDYIFFNRPVIAAVPPDIPLSKLVLSFKNGFACDTYDEIFNAMCTVIKEELRELDPDIHVDMYSRKHKNEEFLQAIIDVISHKPEKRGSK
ncbi:hypothetical protein SDC9_63985 [bioreactor metagenome]|uniref:Glycosyltransferase subfamily 4-like N-terminal domain-containing protein n=1 Tax=bioreactor metagenome TaxID=1076179 RepID=A0A644XPB1_9ZZZZ|nr:glycosyltransferase [Candidatus Metalachnospira sp.]